MYSSCSRTAISVAVSGSQPAAKHVSYFCLPYVALVKNHCIQNLIKNSNVMRTSEAADAIRVGCR